MADAAFFAEYGEASRIVNFLDEPADTAARRIVALYWRHAAGVCGVFDDAISVHAEELREGSLPEDCLLRLVVGQDATSREYAAPSKEPEPAAAFNAAIPMAIDEERGRVLFDRWGEIKGVGAELLCALAIPFREAMQEERAPERFPFTTTADLLRQTKCDNEETLRRRVHRCRRSIERMATEAGYLPPSIDDVIENHPWHGYRLNPDRIRIVALSELVAVK